MDLIASLIVSMGSAEWLPSLLVQAGIGFWCLRVLRGYVL